MSVAEAIPERVVAGRNYTVTEAADYLRLSAPYLNRLRYEGGGPTFAKLGVRVVYRQADLDDWLQSHRRQSTAEFINA